MNCKFIKTVLKTCRYTMMLSVGALSMTGTSSATLIESIAALDEGAKYRVLFVTSTKRNATSHEISDYNTFVNDVAQTGSVTSGLGLTWRAIASTDGDNAQDNTGIENDDDDAVTMFNTLGNVIALSGRDLWDGVGVIFNRWDQDSNAVSGLVWTGTSINGVSILNRTMGGSGYSRYGVATAVYGAGQSWMSASSAPSSTHGYFYGVSAVSTKPLSNVPAPGTVILLSLGLAGLLFARYRKQY
jgi:hypothetical protein